MSFCYQQAMWRVVTLSHCSYHAICATSAFVRLTSFPLLGAVVLVKQNATALLQLKYEGMIRNLKHFTQVIRAQPHVAHAPKALLSACLRAHGRLWHKKHFSTTFATQPSHVPPRQFSCPEWKALVIQLLSIDILYDNLHGVPVGAKLASRCMFNATASCQFL